MKLVNLHHPNEKVWDEYARDRFERHFDEYVSRPLVNATDSAVVQWIDSVVDADEEVVVLVTHPDMCPWMQLKEKLDQITPHNKLFVFAGEGMGNEDKMWKMLANMAMANICDGVFVASAWHQYKLTKMEWPDNKIHFVGYPVDDSTVAKDPPEDNTIVCHNASDNLDFVLDVIEHFLLGADAMEASLPITFDIGVPEATPGDPKRRLQDLRIARLAKEMPSLVTIQAVYSPDGAASHPAKGTKVVWAAAPRDSFDDYLARSIMDGSHPVVPRAGCYMEMVRMDLSQDRYAYKPNDIRSCSMALLKGLKAPSPPKKYIDAYSTAFDQMANIMNGAKEE